MPMGKGKSVTYIHTMTTKVIYLKKIFLLCFRYLFFFCKDPKTTPSRCTTAARTTTTASRSRAVSWVMSGTTSAPQGENPMTLAQSTPLSPPHQPSSTVMDSNSSNSSLSFNMAVEVTHREIQGNMDRT
jgi:hypothetical protein